MRFWRKIQLIFWKKLIRIPDERAQLVTQIKGELDGGRNCFWNWSEMKPRGTGYLLPAEPIGGKDSYSIWKFQIVLKQVSPSSPFSLQHTFIPSPETMQRIVAQLCTNWKNVFKNVFAAILSSLSCKLVPRYFARQLQIRNEENPKSERLGEEQRMPQIIVQRNLKS